MRNRSCNVQTRAGSGKIKLQSADQNARRAVGVELSEDFDADRLERRVRWIGLRHHRDDESGVCEGREESKRKDGSTGRQHDILSNK